VSLNISRSPQGQRLLGENSRQYLIFADSAKHGTKKALMIIYQGVHQSSL
jgi:hypothetical protein